MPYPIITADNAQQLVEIHRASRGWITEIQWASHGQALAVASASGVALYTLEGLQLRGLLEGHDGPVKGLAISHDGRYIVSASADTTIRIWDLKQPGQYHILKGHQDAVNSLALSADDHWLASAGADHTVRLWNFQTSVVRYVLTGHSDEVTSVAFSGADLISGSRDHSLRLWDNASGTLRATLNHDDWVRDVQVNPVDTQWIASASKDMTVRLWHRTQQRILLHAHDNGADRVRFSPDGSLLVTSGRDNLIKFWKAKTGEAVGQIAAHEKPVLALAFSPDGRILATGSGDNTVRLWAVG
ncbi:MAG: WD40 repeat domain-containing protein [Anaerolineae bacterium]|nr:WD40 repeat domain-containing protein [Anaerolineae bacterium]